MASLSPLLTGGNQRRAKEKEVNINGTRNAEKVLKRNVSWYDGQYEGTIAIDFGTSTLAVAWQKDGGDVKELMIHQNSRSIPTVLLIKGSDKVEIGEKAFIDYHKLISAEPPRSSSTSTESRHQEVVFFEKIKMELQNDKTVHRASTIMGSNGKEYYLMEVIALVLKKVRLRVQDRICRFGVRSTSSFSWVLTVPALWGGSARCMMKDSAYLAGLCSTSGSDVDMLPLPLLPAGGGRSLPTINWETSNPNRVSLVFEPEAAASWCMTLDGGTVKDRTDLEASLTTAQCFLTVDVGGGTIDITAHQVNEEDRMVFFHLPSGKVHGGTCINEDFITFLEEITEHKMSHYYEAGGNEFVVQRQAEIQELKSKKFEEAKIQFTDFGEKEDDDFCPVALPKTYCQLYQSILLRKSRENDNEALFSFVEPTNQLRLYETLMKKLMTKSLEEITKCIRSSITHIKETSSIPVKIIYLVGGFGGSDYVIDHVKKTFPNMTVVAPQLHELAIVKGACLYAKNKPIRIADATYGTECKVQYNEKNEVHQKAEIVEGYGGKRFCKHLFKPFVHIGEPLDPEYVFKTVYSPITEDQSTLQLTLYSTMKRNVDIVQREGNLNTDLKKLADVVVNLEELKAVPFKNRLINVLVDFSSVEITICAYFVSKGKEVRLKSSTEFMSTIEMLKAIENNDNIVEV